MLILLPLLAFVALFASLHGRAQEEDWRTSFLQAALVWGGAVTLFSEGLSLLGALTRTWVAVLWSALLLTALAAGWQSGTLARAWARASAWASARKPLDWADAVLVGGLAVIAGLLLAIALVCPPNNTDSLQYHMSRVMHWAQSGSLRHYPTGFEPQLFQPIGAELAILHLRLLRGADLPANLVQWSTLVGSVVGVSALAALLGADRRGQLLACCFVMSLPIGILESTSTQNDYVTAFWLIALAYHVLLVKEREPGLWEWCSLALSLGLGLLTKGTFYLYAIPFLAWLFLSRLRRPVLVRTMLEAGAVLVIAVILNAGFWTRNIQTYGLPLGAAETMSRFTQARPSPGRILFAWLANTALNLPTPSEQVNSRLVRAISDIGDTIRADGDHFNLIWGWNNENLAGNPMHAALVFLAVGVVFLVRSQPRPSVARRYAVVVIASVLFVFAVIAFDVYGVRYQLPFFVAAAPVVGVATTQIGKPRLTVIVGALLLLAALPWVLFNASRPIIGLRPRTMTDSIFLESPVRILFANRVDLQDPYVAAAEAIKATGCQNVGLRLDSHDLEYPWWWLLQAPQSGYRLETIYTLPWLEKLVDPDFRPCAILCTICGDERTTLHGLPLVQDFGPVRLYAGPSYRPEEDR